MPESLLRTKLFVPPLRPSLVPRPHLIERLNQGLQHGHKLTLISASAGFGKTTLINEWTYQCRCPVAWLSLDDGDNDLTRFITYIVAAFRTLYSSFAQGVLTSLQSSGITNSKMALTALLNEIAGLPDDVVLVLDDYHVIESRPIDEAVGFLLEHLPPQMHLMIVSRVDPSMPLSRLRASGQMTEIRVDDLRFTLEETSTFFNQTTDCRLSAPEIAALEDRTEGWVAGLQLAALSMKSYDDLTEFVRSFTGDDRYILDYFGEEVLSHQSQEVQSFLLQTSLLDRLSGPLCDAITGTGDGQEMLESLERDNLFVVPLDNERCWYRYHHLFADLLQARLKRFHPDRVTALHMRVSLWFGEHGSMAEAVGHAFSAMDYDRAASLIEQSANESLLHGHLTTILQWLNELPDSILESRPRLRFYQARALSLAGQSRKAEMLAVDARSTLEQLPDSPENLALRGELAALLTGIVVYRSEPSRVIREAEEALTYLPKDELNLRARVHIALGTAYAYQNEMRNAVETYQRTKDLALRAGNPFLATAANDMFAELQIYHMGRLQESAQALPQIVEMGRNEDGTLQPYAGTSLILLAEINIEWNNLKTASDYMARGFELLQQGGIGYSLIHSYCAKSRLELALGEIELAVESLHSATQVSQSYPLMHMLIHNLACQVKSALYLGESKTAYRWAIGEKCKLPENLPTYLYEVQQIALARVTLAQGDLWKTINILDKILPPAESAGRLAHVIEIYLLKALALQGRGESAAAIACLTTGLSLSAPEGYIRTFVEFGAPMAHLLNQVAVRGFMPDYTSKLLAAFGAENRVNMPPHSQPLVEPLSPRELEVLQLIADGLTNREISEKLVVALDTVKGHNYRIFGKLGVKNRTQAIKTAVSLKILPPQ